MRILCGVDFSQTSKDAAAVAARLARSSGATLELVHIVPSTRPRDSTTIPPDLRTLAAGLGKGVGVAAREGEGPEGLLAAAAGKPTDLIVVGTRGGGSSRVALGSTAKRLLSLSPIPVLVVPAAGAAGGPIVAATDGSPFAEAAVAAAAMWAGLLHVPIEAVEVVAAPKLGPRTGKHPESTSEATAKELQAAERALAQRTGAVAGSTQWHARAVVRGDSTASTILDAATAAGASMVAVGTHGRSGLSQLAYGSVAQDVVSKAKIPVLVVPARR